MYSFGTIFDFNYLSRGLALRYSLRQQKINFSLYVLCLDQKTFDFFKGEQQKDTIAISLSQLESYFPELLVVKANRSWAEYIFTLSPCWPLYLIDVFSDISFITTMDADLYFFSSPEVLLSKIKYSSVLITPHRFSKKNLHLSVYGYFNVSFQSFKNDEIGISCLKKWKQDCINWCYDRLECDLFADQKYLDSWIGQFGPKVTVIDHLGAGLAPWNIEGVRIKLFKGELFADDSRIIFYHFHNLRFVGSRLFISGLLHYNVTNYGKFYRHFYSNYIYIVKKFSLSIGQLSDKSIRNHFNYGIKDLLVLFIFGYLDFYLNKSCILRLRFGWLGKIFLKLNRIKKNICHILLI